MSDSTFGVGERVQLSDPKGRLHTVVLEVGKQFPRTAVPSSTMP